jgi:hypothetical protein
MVSGAELSAILVCVKRSRMYLVNFRGVRTAKGSTNRSPSKCITWQLERITTVAGSN